MQYNRAETIKRLKQKGFKVITGFSYLYINQQGQVFSLITGKYIEPNTRNCIRPRGEWLSVPKLVLQEFGMQLYRSGQITYLDGDKSNMSIKNIKYSRIFAPDRTAESVNSENLTKAIRCYIQVTERFNANDKLHTRLYLQTITKQRQFFIYYQDSKHIEVFKTYIEGNSKNETAKKHGLGIRDCSVIVNRFINLFVSDVLHEFEAGLLIIQPYKLKPITATQAIREYNREIIKIGGKPLPLRKKSLKESLQDWQKTLNEIKKAKIK